jgi:eukaryotic-like serine/threonine-protein kinase
VDRSRPNTHDSGADAEVTEPQTTLEGDSDDGVPRPSVTQEQLTRGSTVGRYTVLEKIGSGGMGVVYAAFDPQLDRKVALKVMHPRSGAREHSRGGRQRLLREAQAMAKLSHPNVITVHDVGTFGERVFVAMEFIEGCTLRSWLSNQKREWSDVVDAFVEAGRGLAAAHAAGIVHRDFKPDNVLMGLTGIGREQTDGRVIVMDFGLARQASVRTARTSLDPDKTLDSRPGGEDLSLTRTGALLGTPAYMAPEQHKNGPVGPAADQFSFCVALWEGLYGERPFGGTNVTSVAMNVLEGRIRPPPRDAQVPTWLRDVLTRGLSVAPSDRYASMDALLAELQRDPPQDNRPWLAAGVAVVLASATVAVYLVSTSTSGPSCDDAHAHIEGVWNDDRARAVRAALTRSSLSYAEASAQSVASIIDAYTERWARVHAETCTMDRGSRRPHATVSSGAGMRCAAERLAELDALLDVYAFEPEAAVVDHAVSAALALAPPERCLDPTDHRPADDTAKARRIAMDLPVARAFLLTGRPHKALEHAAPLADLAASADDFARESEVLLVIAGAHVEKNDLMAAERSLRRAIVSASTAGRPDLEARGWTRMVELVGLRSHDFVDGRRLALAAESGVARAGSPADLHADLLVLLGAMNLAEGNDQDAFRDFDRALRMRREHLASNHLDVASAAEGVGLALDALGRHTEAVEHHTAVLSTREQVLGTQHPLCGIALSHLGAAMLGANEVRRATATLIRARMILDPEGDVSLDQIPEEANATPSTPEVDDASEHDRNLAVVLDRLGLAMRATEKLDVASRLHGHAAAMMTALPASDRDLAYPLGNLGLALTELGHSDEALPHLRRALQLAESTLAPGHHDRGILHLNLANASWALGEIEDARVHYDHALRIWEDIADEHPLLAYALTGVGRARLAANDAPGAVEMLDRAFELRDHEQEDAMNLAETSLLLARALWATQRNSQRALELAAHARDLAKSSEPADASDLERLLSGAEIFGLSDRLVPAGLGLIDRRHPPH